MKYMLLVYSPEDAWTPDEWQSCVSKSTDICHELVAKGQFRAASPLHPVATAATVRVREGQRVVTDGPFTETKEQLGGYFIIDVDNLDDAIAVAARLPAAKKGTIEIRPIFVLDGLPQTKQLAESLQMAQKPGEASLRRYMLLCYDDEAAWERAGEAELRAAMERGVALTHELDKKGRFIAASPLHGSTSATSVRVRNDRRQVTDGPFMETREVLGGFYVILAQDQNEALEVAARHPGVFVGAVEVRAMHDVSALPVL